MGSLISLSPCAVASNKPSGVCCMSPSEQLTTVNPKCGCKVAVLGMADLARSCLAANSCDGVAGLRLRRRHERSYAG